RPFRPSWRADCLRLYRWSPYLRPISPRLSKRRSIPGDRRLRDLRRLRGRIGLGVASPCDGDSGAPSLSLGAQEPPLLPAKDRPLSEARASPSSVRRCHVPVPVEHRGVRKQPSSPLVVDAQARHLRQLTCAPLLRTCEPQHDGGSWPPRDCAARGIDLKGVKFDEATKHTMTTAVPHAGGGEPRRRENPCDAINSTRRSVGHRGRPPWGSASLRGRERKTRSYGRAGRPGVCHAETDRRLPGANDPRRDHPWEDSPMKLYEPFRGVIGRTLAESKPDWPERQHPGEGAPNVVVILLDDLGFSHFGCYGSTIETPHIDRLATAGLRYTNFHVTPLCSPTRAALLTGRNHHEVGMRSVSNFNTGFPNMRGHVSNHAATVAEVLRDRGYTTFGVGKWHLCQMEDASAAGPYDQWPCQRGFDRFYGFLDGETDQFHPELIYDNHAVDPLKTVQEGYHLSEDLVDRAIGFVHDTKSIRPDRPFFLYVAFGATHAPHQAPAPYLEKYRGRFDQGWDSCRDEWFGRQRGMGLLPESTLLAPRNPGVEPWADLPESHRILAARLQEAFAGFLDHTDAQIGRLVNALTRLGELDNTLIFLLSDNGASQEGGPFGVLHEWKFFNFVIETPDEAIRH